MLKKLNCKDKAVLVLASLAGVGFTPLVSGTAASLLGLLFFWLIKSEAIFFALVLFSLGLAFVISGKAEKILQEKDCQKIVIDDFAGMLITFLFVPRTLVFMVSGFFIFRLLDTLKIPPADRLEKKNGSPGVVGDDLIAGIFANLTLQSLRLLLKISL